MRDNNRIIKQAIFVQLVRDLIADRRPFEVAIRVRTEKERVAIRDFSEAELKFFCIDELGNG